jgi:hypothetical protein
MAKHSPNFTPMRRSEQRTSSRELLEYLRSDDKLGSLLPTVEQVVQLQAACEQQLPSLFNSCQVMQLREGTLHISAPNAALATRLRQVLPKLQQGLREKGWGVEQIRLKVQLMPTQPAPAPASEPRVLSSSAIASFASLASQIEESPLRDALQNLLKHQSKL